MGESRGVREAVEPGGRRTRRAILAGAGAAAVAWAAQAIGRPAPVSATSGTFDSTIGNAVSGTTTSTESFAIFGTSAAGTGTGGGILGASASPDGTGVKGAVFDPQSGKYGVWGYAETGVQIPVYAQHVGTTGQSIGVLATSASDTGIAVYGEVTDAVADHENYGVFGLSHSALGRGVFGWAESASAGTGVWGQSDGAAGAGVQGYAWDGFAATGQFGTGVIGTSGSHAFPPPAPRSNTGVMGYSPNGTGGYFGSASGVALQAAGKVRLSRSGKVSVAAGKASAVVDLTAKGGIAANTLIVATIQTYRVGVSVASVRLNYPSAGKATIYLTRVPSTSSATSVAWIAAES